MGKKKKNVSTASKKQVDGENCNAIRTESQVSSPSLSLLSVPVDDETICQEETKAVPFKNSSYEAKKSNKRKIWKGLKQILAQERLLVLQASDAVLYSSIDAPPSFRPAKKYSDLSGLLGNYTDPHTQLRYALVEEYQTIQTLPSDIVAGYLTLRKASNPVG